MVRSLRRAQKWAIFQKQCSRGVSRLCRLWGVPWYDERDKAAPMDPRPLAVVSVTPQTTNDSLPTGASDEKLWKGDAGKRGMA